MAMSRQQDHQSRAIHELCVLVLGIIRPSSTAASRRMRPSAAGLASLLLGMSVAMMLCGWVTFVIGFILMPWVLGLVVVLCVAGIVSNLSGLGQWMASAAAGLLEPEGALPKERNDQIFSKLPII